ncbi:MAG: hypothetical protein IJB54_04320 [Firmicutes bacterium]|nr:hypothetical protein [Bacillota bacterium]
MNIQECKDKLNACLSKASKADLNWAAIFFKSPLTGEVECRTIYSDERNEVLFWVENIIEFYTKDNIPFAAYVNNDLWEAKLELFNK